MINLIMKQEFGYYFPTGVVQHPSLKELFFCDNFVREMLGTAPSCISVKVSIFRPHQKGWKKIKIGGVSGWRVYISGKKTNIVTTAKQDRILASEGLENHPFWMNITPEVKA